MKNNEKEMSGKILKKNKGKYIENESNEKILKRKEWKGNENVIMKRYWKLTKKGRKLSKTISKIENSNDNFLPKIKIYKKRGGRKNIHKYIFFLPPLI